MHYSFLLQRCGIDDVIEVLHQHIFKLVALHGSAARHDAECNETFALRNKCVNFGTVAFLNIHLISLVANSDIIGSFALALAQILNYICFILQSVTKDSSRVRILLQSEVARRAPSAGCSPSVACSVEAVSEPLALADELSAFPLQEKSDIEATAAAAIR